LGRKRRVSGARSEAKPSEADETELPLPPKPRTPRCSPLQAC